jgi:hypothetical protein
LLWLAWRWLLRITRTTICMVAIDAVHDEMAYRFGQAEQTVYFWRGTICALVTWTSRRRQVS